MSITTHSERPRAAAASDGRLAAIARDIAADQASWRQHVRFDPSGRYWRKLLSTTDADVWLLTWLPDQSTDFHDHGPSSASFVIVQGVLEEVRATADGRISRSWYGPGQGGDIAPGEIHDVLNTGIDPAVSIHVYSPRLEVMNFWGIGEHGLRPLMAVPTDQPEL